MTLAEQLADDLSTVFFNADDFGVAITYRRGGSAVSLTAIVETDVTQMLTTTGVTQVSTRSYQVIASKLILGASVVLPLPGDTITEGATTYIVPQQRDRPTFEFVDENNLILRINTTLQRIQ
jgi:hypothetical protein